MKMPSDSTVREMLAACERHYTQLMAGGCAEEVARDRTWDAYECAFMETSTNCCDPRDRLFESKLRRTRTKG